MRRQGGTPDSPDAIVAVPGRGRPIGQSRHPAMRARQAW
jgi:hypothetical protein